MKLNIIESTFTSFRNVNNQARGDFVIFGIYMYHENNYYCIYFGGRTYKALLFLIYADAKKYYDQYRYSMLRNGFNNVLIVSYDNYFDKTLSDKEFVKCYGYFAKQCNSSLALMELEKNDDREVLSMVLNFNKIIDYRLVQSTLFNKVM